MIYDCATHPEHAPRVKNVYVKGERVPYAFYANDESGVVMGYGTSPRWTKDGRPIIHVTYADIKDIRVELNEMEDVA